MGKLSALLNPLTYVVINLAIVAILKTGSVRVDAGVITQGQLIALYNYMSQILVELIKFANLILNITKSVACAGRISQVLETKSSMADGQDALPDGSGSPALQFCGVSFRYPGAGADALSSISFSAAPGQTIGVIGGTGAGKSTLANLIPRFYDATQGQVLVCGEDVRQLRLQAPRPRSASCRRRRCSSPAPSATISAGAMPRPAMKTSGRRCRTRRPTRSSAASRAGWTRKSSPAGAISPAASASG